jgi:hypothetical protein
MEMQWLLEAIVHYHSISDFRKNNPIALKSYSNSMFFLKDADLIGCETIAIDGTKAEPTIARKPILIKRKSTNM